MKKLMIAAAVAAMGAGAFAGACSPEDPVTPVGPCATVYAVKINLKTPTSVWAKWDCSTKGEICLPGEEHKNEWAVRKPGTYAVQGWMAYCDCGCNSLKTFTEDHIALWSTSEKKEKMYWQDMTYTVDLLQVIGKTQKDAEIVFNLKGYVDNAEKTSGLGREFDLRAAGFGKFSKNIYTSFSGNVVGTVSDVYYPHLVLDPETDELVCPEAGYFDCADLCTILIEDPSVAYGTFTLKYNASASKKFANAIWPTLPTYVPYPVGWDD